MKIKCITIILVSVSIASFCQEPSKISSARKVNATVLSKSTIQGLDNHFNRFVEPIEDGTLVIGENDVTKLSLENIIVWKYTEPGQDTLQIDCFSKLKSGGFILSGFRKKKNKITLLLLNLDATGKKVWEKVLPAKNTDVLAILEKGDGGLQALMSQYKSKQYFQSIWSFDNNGNIKDQIKIPMGGDVGAFVQDVKLLEAPENGLFLFGATSAHNYEGVRLTPYSRSGNKFFIATDAAIIEHNIFDRIYSNLTIVGNPAGGFYASYSFDNSRNLMAEDFRLVSLDSGLNAKWTKDIGGDKIDGITSMIIDGSSNLYLGGFSYSGVSGQKSEPAFEKDHCDAWVIKVDSNGEKLWDKTITGPGCVLGVRLFLQNNRIGVIFNEESSTIGAFIVEQ